MAGSEVGLASYIRALLEPPAEQEHPHTVLVRLLNEKWSTGRKLLAEGRYSEVLELWVGVDRNEYLNPSHQEWKDKSAFRAMVRSVVMQLFVVYANRRGVGELDEQVRQAYYYADMLERDRLVFLELAQVDGTLDMDVALIQDKNNLDDLRAVCKWGRDWSGFVDIVVPNSVRLDLELQTRVVDLERRIADYEATLK